MSSFDLDLDDAMKTEDSNPSDFVNESHTNTESLLKDTDDESDDNELDIFLSLMNKAEKKNEKRMMKKKNQFDSTKTDWSTVRLDNVKAEDTSDSEDEDDYEETTKFMSLMSKAKEKNSVVKLSYVQGKMKMTKITNGYEGELMYKAMKERMSDKLVQAPNQTNVSGRGVVTITRLPVGDEGKDLVQKRKEEYRAKTSGKEARSLESSRGKRKFEDRMTLAEASAEDFNDSQDYVNFLQDKLQGIRIKLVK